MNVVANIGAVPSPKHRAGEIADYESECKNVLRPLLDGMIEMAEKAGWRRRTVASSLMFLAAQHVSRTIPSGTTGHGRHDAL
ncbi:MAG: hypothetical protein KF810_10175 [Rhizobiaceae bacterium]|nr:hypothetical protein [Rhizobiaceae bacterium]